jgi:nicotinate dehydrogenase subunit B
VSYPILTIPDAPALDIALIDRPSERPMDVGEASASPVAAAIANSLTRPAYVCVACLLRESE